MSKEEFLKIQTCVLKVNIHCDGCKQKVKKTLHKIDGVYKTSIDAENGKVTVYGNVDSTTLIKKLNKCGKHAEFWGAPKLTNNSNNHNQNIKNLNNVKPVQPHISNNNNKNQNHKGGGGGGAGGGGQQIQLKGGGGGGLPQPTLQQIQQLQKMKQQMPGNFPKGVKFNLPAKHEMEDDEFDDDFDDDDEDDFDDDDFDDEVDDLPPLNKVPTKPPMMGVPGAGKGMMPNMMNPHLMNLGKGGGGGGGGGNGNVPVHVNNGKSGGNNGGNIQNHGGGGAKSGGKHGGPLPGNIKMAGGGGGGGKNIIMNGGGNGGMNEGGLPHHAMMSGMRPNVGNNPHGMPPHHNGGGVGPNMGQGMGLVPTVAQLAHMQMSQMGSIPAVQGLPAGPVGSVGPRYFHGVPPSMMGGPAGGNPYQQQYLTQMMMNQQRANGNDQFQPMMYARPAPAMQYMPPYVPPSDPYTHYFSDENTSSSCSIM